MTDLNLAYMDTCGPIPTLLIHGFMLNNNMWGPQYDDLYDATRIIAPDLPGHGYSDSYEGEYSVEMMAEKCRELLAALHIEPPFVIGGVSMGGYVALEFYRRYKTEVAGLILTATRAIPDSAEAKNGRNEQIELVKREGVPALTDRLLPLLVAPETNDTMPEMIEALRQMLNATSTAGVIGGLQAMRDRPDAQASLDEIEVPTLVLHGQEDLLIPYSQAEQMAEAIPHAEMYLIPAAGHLPNLEQPEIFNELLAEFYEGL